jgi:protein NrfC
MENAATDASDQAADKLLESAARRRFLGLGLKVAGVSLGGSLLCLTTAEKAHSEALGVGVIATFPYSPHYSMIVRQGICTGCGKCVTACSETNNVPRDGYRNLVFQRRAGAGSEVKNLEFLPVLCNHCNRPPCVRACPTRALSKDKTNGIVMVNSKLCIGCRACMASCPYHALYYKQAEAAVDKCDFCLKARLLRGRISTACAESCPVGALVFGNLADPQSELHGLLHASDQTVWVLRPELGTMPNVFYLRDQPRGRQTNGR